MTGWDFCTVLYLWYLHKAMGQVGICKCKFPHVTDGGGGICHLQYNLSVRKQYFDSVSCPQAMQSSTTPPIQQSKYKTAMRESSQIQMCVTMSLMKSRTHAQSNFPECKPSWIYLHVKLLQNPFTSTSTSKKHLIIWCSVQCNIQISPQKRPLLKVDHITQGNCKVRSTTL